MNACKNLKRDSLYRQPYCYCHFGIYLQKFLQTFMIVDNSRGQDFLEWKGRQRGNVAMDCLPCLFLLLACLLFPATCLSQCLFLFLPRFLHPFFVHNSGNLFFTKWWCHNLFLARCTFIHCFKFYSCIIFMLFSVLIRTSLSTGCYLSSLLVRECDLCW